MPVVTISICAVPVIVASITLFVASFRKYTTGVLEIEDSESAE